jgi:branched-chain amino acid transport system substrate-binding protein
VKRSMIAVGMITLAVALAALSFVGACAPTPTAPGVPKEILIGDVVSYTGAFAPFGRGAFGVEAAVEDINKLGGIYIKEYDTRIPVRWITADCESDPLKVAPLTEDMILRDKVQFLGMHLEAAMMRQGTAMMADKYKIPAVYGVGPLETFMSMKQSAGATWKYSYTFGFAMATPPEPGDFRENNPGYLFIPSMFGALEAASGQTNKKMALFAGDNADGRSWYMVFSGISTEQGYDCYRVKDSFGIYPPGTTDFSPLIKEWKDAGCEILWGNCVGPDFGTMLRQCKAQGFKPKVVFATMAADYYADIIAWGGDLPLGVYMENWFVLNPKTKNDRGIGDTTTQSLADRWYKKTGESYEGSGIGWDYMGAQILFNAIERAGTLDSDAVLKAIGETDFMCMDGGRVVFEKSTQFHRWPVAVGQWQKTDNPWVWEPKTVFSLNDVYTQTAEQIFPKPWD